MIELPLLYTVAGRQGQGWACIGIETNVSITTSLRGRWRRKGAGGLGGLGMHWARIILITQLPLIPVGGEEKGWAAGAGGSGGAKGVWACIELELNCATTLLNYHCATRSLENKEPP